MLVRRTLIVIILFLTAASQGQVAVPPYLNDEDTTWIRNASAFFRAAYRSGENNLTIGEIEALVQELEAGLARGRELATFLRDSLDSYEHDYGEVPSDLLYASTAVASLGNALVTLQEAYKSRLVGDGPQQRVYAWLATTYYADYQLAWTQYQQQPDTNVTR